MAFTPVVVTKNGKERVAQTPSDLVRYNFDGWKVKSDAPARAKREETK